MSRKAEHNILKITYVLLLLFVGLFLISPFLIPIFFGGTVALALYPLQLKLESYGISRKRASLLLTIFFGVIISIPFSFFVVKGTVEVTNQLEKFQTDSRYQDQGVQNIVSTLKKNVVTSVHKYLDKVGLGNVLTDAKIEGYLAETNTFLLSFFQSFVAALPVIFLYFLVMIICIYSFLKRAEGIRHFFQQVFGFNHQKMNQLVRIFIMDSRQVFVSNIATGSIQSLCVSSAAALLGLGEFFLIFFVTLILSFIPVIGAAPVAFLFAIYAFFQDLTTPAIIMLVVGMFTGVIDNILRPYLASLGESKIPPVAAFICVIGGALLLGFPGLFVGLLVGTIAYDTLPLFWYELGKTPESNSENKIFIRSSDEQDSKRH